MPIASTATGRWFTKPFIQHYSDILASLSNDLGTGSPGGYVSCYEALAKVDVREQFKDMTISVLVVADIQDHVATIIDSKFIQKYIAGNQLFEIDASHVSNVEQPEVFNRAVQEFIQA